MQESIPNGSLLPPLQYVRCQPSIKRFLRMGLIGDIGHVSCLDVQQPQDRKSSDCTTVELLANRAAGQLVELAFLLDAHPTAIMAHMAPDNLMPSLQVFLSLGSDVAVQYSTSLHSSNDEHVLWLEGSKGSIRTNSRSVWWRKRGWPLFAPVSLPFSLASLGRQKNRSPSEKLAELAAAIITSQQQETEVEISGEKVHGASV